MTDKIILALDTSTLTGSVAVIVGTETIVEVSERVTTHSEKLLPLIERALDGAGRPLSDIDAIACGAGPGTFTGLRIGLSTAKGLCYAANKPLVLVPSLTALAMNGGRRGEPIVPLIDARKGQVFAGFYRFDGPEPEPTRCAVAAAPGAVAEMLEIKGAFLLGSGYVAYPEHFGNREVADRDHQVHAASVGRLATGKLGRGEIEDLGAAQPTYLRASDAELGTGLFSSP